MKCAFVSVALCVSLLLGPAALAEETADAAGYIISYDLKGADRDRGTAVVRNGAELPPKLWMPLFAGDSVFIREADSDIVLDMAEGGRVEVKGTRQRFTVGEGGSDSGVWGLITQIASLFGGEEEEGAPTNLMSKGDGSLEVQMAMHGPNLIIGDGRPLWVAWRGGKGPYTLTLDTDAMRMPLGIRAGTETEIGIPKAVGNRFTLLIEDKLGKHVRIVFQLRKTAPEMPKDLVDEAALHDAKQALMAGWLAAQDDGAWRFEVARILRAMPKDDKTARNLLDAVARGWRPHD